MINRYSAAIEPDQANGVSEPTQPLRISIIVPIRNEAQHIQKTLSQLVGQLPHNFASPRVHVLPVPPLPWLPSPDSYRSL
jgi:hypothetical protein